MHCVGLGWGGPVSFCIQAVAVFTLTFAENEVVKKVRSSLGMSDWQINAVHFIDLINGHSWPKVCQSRCFPFFPTCSIHSHQNKLGLRGAHASLFNNMRHKRIFCLYPFVNRVILTCNESYK